MNQFIKTIKYHKIDLIIDIGAGEGEFALELIRAGYKGSIVSIEPLTDVYKSLTENSRIHRNWMVFPRMAIGNRNSQVSINVSQNSVSSSLLNILPIHLNSAPDSKYIRKEKVKMYKLDTFIDEFKKYKNILIKIDAQGYENYILDGAKKLIRLRNLKGLFIEVSFAKLYKNQKTFDYFYNELNNKGFDIWAVEKVLIEKGTGRLLQINLLEFKSF
jgi:FkbM family methyltransferase